MLLFVETEMRKSKNLVPNVSSWGKRAWQNYKLQINESSCLWFAVTRSHVSPSKAAWLELSPSTSCQMGLANFSLFVWTHFLILSSHFR